MEFIKYLFKWKKSPQPDKTSSFCRADSAIKPIRKRIQKIGYGIEEIEARLDQILDTLSELRAIQIQRVDSSGHELSREQIETLLSLSDNIFYAQKAMEGPARESLSILQQQIKRLLTSFDIQLLLQEKVPFDDRVHEAKEVVFRQELPDLQVVHVLRPGYILKDGLLRPAWVVVNRHDIQ